jgi:coxsackievirus/adenovirus receptor
MKIYLTLNLYFTPKGSCPTTCATYGDSRGSRPVCGTDGRDYPNVCELRRHSCKEMKEISVKFTGACGQSDFLFI